MADRPQSDGRLLFCLIWYSTPHHWDGRLGAGRADEGSCDRVWPKDCLKGGPAQPYRWLRSGSIPLCGRAHRCPWFFFSSFFFLKVSSYGSTGLKSSIVWWGSYSKTPNKPSRAELSHLCLNWHLSWNWQVSLDVKHRILAFPSVF